MPVLWYDNRRVRAADVKAIWARRFERPEVLDQTSPEYQTFVAREFSDCMEAFIDASNASCMNTYEADRKAGNRLYQSVMARSVGFRVPETLVTQNTNLAAAFIGKLRDAVVVKAVSFGVVSEELDLVAHTSRVDKNFELTGLAGCPTLLQEEIEKKHEWRVTTVGEKVFSARTRKDVQIDQTDWRRTDDVCSIFERAELPLEIAGKLLCLCERGGIKFGAHDLIETPSGDFYFLETNPAGQWGWLEVHLGLAIGEAIASWLKSAARVR